MALADPQRESLGRRYTAEGRGRYRQRESAADEPFRYRPAWRRHSHLQAKFVKTDGRLERGMHDAVNLNDVFDRGDGPPIDPDALSKAFRLARGKLGLDRVRLRRSPSLRLDARSERDERPRRLRTVRPLDRLVHALGLRPPRRGCGRGSDQRCRTDAWRVVGANLGRIIPAGRDIGPFQPERTRRPRGLAV
jgi:hypothetical protein